MKRALTHTRTAKVTITKKPLAKISLVIEWDPATTPQAQQDAVLKGIGQTLAAAMTPAEARAFLAQMAGQRPPARKRETPQQSEGEKA